MRKPAMPERSLRLLLLAMELLDRGAADLRSPSLFGPGLALAAFHDAVEYCLVAVAHHVGAEPKPTLDAVWKAVNDKSPTGTTLPRQSSMIAMNKTRVAFKHHGVLPDRAQVEEFHAEAHLFLREAVRQYFDADFDALSALDLLERGPVRDLPAAAMLQLVANESEGALALPY